MSTADSKRLVRLSAGTLLNATDYTQKRLGAVVTETVREAAAEMAEHKRQDRRRTAALVSLMLLSRRMSTRARDAVLDGRQHARTEATRRLAAELAAAGIAGRTVIGHGHHDRHDEDDTYATTAGEALSVAWRGLALVALSAATRKDADPITAISKTQRMMEPRIVRIASTETAQAFNDEHRRALRETAENDSAFAAQLRDERVMRMWSAMLDACPVCWEHDGEKVEYNEDFIGGDVPGYMHPNCRCTEVLVTEAAALAA